MSRQIRLTFIDEGISIGAEMLDDQAPKTCQIIWDLLPLEEDAVHAIYSGSEIAYFLSQDIKIPKENQTSRVLPGDI